MLLAHLDVQISCLICSHVDANGDRPGEAGHTLGHAEPFTFSAALRSNFALRKLSHPNADDALCRIAGLSCNPTDLLGVDCQLPVAQGGLLGVLMSGSYSPTACPLLFLAREKPVELVRDEGKIEIGRRRFGITDFS